MELQLRAGAFYGRTTKTLELSGFRFTEKVYEPRISIPKHGHELPHFCLVLNGTYTESLGGKLEERQPSTLLFYPSDLTHTESHRMRGRHFLIELEKWRMDGTKEYVLPSSEPIVLNQISPRGLAARLYAEFRYPDDLSALALEGIMLELLAETSRHRIGVGDRTPPQWLAQAKKILHTSFSNPPRLDELAKAVGVHPAHLAREFRRFQRCTIGEYVRRLRIDYARHRMATTADSLIEIALSAGFADQTHFSRSFKRVMGLTPMQFRSTFSKR